MTAPDDLTPEEKRYLDTPTGRTEIPIADGTYHAKVVKATIRDDLPFDQPEGTRWVDVDFLIRTNDGLDVPRNKCIQLNNHRPPSPKIGDPMKFAKTDLENLGYKGLATRMTQADADAMAGSLVSVSIQPNKAGDKRFLKILGLLEKPSGVAALEQAFDATPQAAPAVAETVGTVF